MGSTTLHTLGYRADVIEAGLAHAQGHDAGAERLARRPTRAADNSIDFKDVDG